MLKTEAYFEHIVQTLTQEELYDLMTIGWSNLNSDNQSHFFESIEPDLIDNMRAE